MNIAEQLADEIYGLQCDIARLEEANEKLREADEKLREVASLMAAHYLPNNLRMPPKKWRERDRLIREMLGDLEIEVKE